MMHFILTGGPIMWAIVLMGVVALGVFFERSLHLHRARIPWNDFLKGVFNIVERDNIREALTICDDTPGPIARLTATALERREEPLEVLSATLLANGRSEITRMERRLVLIATTAQITPLLGLLGTILKMVEGLVKIEHQSPMVQKIDVLDPILQALVLTGAGLTVAIPCYLAYNMLVIKIERIVTDMESATAEILHALSRRARENGRSRAAGDDGA